MTEPVPASAYSYEPIALVDLLDRVLAKGVVVSGELALSIAGVDLVYVSLRALITSVRAGVVLPSPAGPPETAELAGSEERRWTG